MNTNTHSSEAATSASEDMITVQMPRSMAEALAASALDGIENICPGGARATDNETIKASARLTKGTEDEDSHIEYAAQYRVLKSALDSESQAWAVLTADELVTACEALSNSLHCDWDGTESDDYLEIVTLAGRLQKLRRRKSSTSRYTGRIEFQS